MKSVKNIKYLLLLILFISLIVFPAFKILSKAPKQIKTIVIDPGHGGKDPGCNGAIHKEKEVALAVALELGKLIEENYSDIKVIYTRTTDVFVELEERAQIANKAKADLFISIHCNAAGKPVMIKDPKTGKKKKKTYKNKKGKIVVVEKPNPEPFGSETYVMGLKNEEGKMKVATRENSAIFYEDDYEKKYDGFDPDSPESYIIMSNYTSAYVIQSANLAMKIQEEYTKKAGRINKGVHRQSIWVLWRTAMPSILTEIGYLTNPLEEQFLGSKQGQSYLAKAIFRGFRKYKDEIEGVKKEYNDDIENQTPLENENVKAGNIPGQRKNTDDDDDDDEEDNKTTLIKKDSIKTNNNTLVKNETTPTINSTVTLSQTVSVNQTEVKDTSVSTKSIIEKFKEKNKETTTSSTVTTKNTQTTSAENPINKVNEEEIKFKVQFASSDVELNLKENKYNDILNGSFYKMGNVLKYTSGNFIDFKEAVKHQNSLREKGFKDCFVIAMQKNNRIDVNEARKKLNQ
ncbi:MAG: N-acetylmuramoyl-L-alanine amidase [Bacteroidetes bacterium]|nr:N-acetylmuramoyl-L-alanine amidase [Bacteroidota bacterium]